MRISRSDGLRCDFSANKLTISMSYTSFCNFNSKSDGRRYDFFHLNTGHGIQLFPFHFRISCKDSALRLLRVFLRPPNEVSATPCVLFGNTLRALFLKNGDFFCYGEIFLPNTRGPRALGCLLGFWPSGPKPCRGN